MAVYIEKVCLMKADGMSKISENSHRISIYIDLGVSERALMPRVHYSAGIEYSAGKKQCYCRSHRVFGRSGTVFDMLQNSQ